jgi:hypothetical protein
VRCPHQRQQLVAQGDVLAAQLGVLARELGGAPTGNRNALKHGRWSCELLELRRAVRELVRENAEAIKLA